MDSWPLFLVPPGTEPHLMGSGPLSCQSAIEDGHFGFQTSVPLGAVNMNLLSGTDDELSDMEPIPLNPNLGSPRHEQPEGFDAGDNIGMYCHTTIMYHSNQLLCCLPGIDEQSPDKDEHLAQAALQRTAGIKQKAAIQDNCEWFCMCSLIVLLT